MTMTSKTSATADLSSLSQLIDYLPIRGASATKRELRCPVQ